MIEQAANASPLSTVKRRMSEQELLLRQLEQDQTSQAEENPSSDGYNEPS